MLTIVFFVFLGMIAVAGVFISLMAKKRANGSAQRPRAAMTDAPKMGRAHGEDD
jgi:hypothetical protein